MQIQIQCAMTDKHVTSTFKNLSGIASWNLFPVLYIDKNLSNTLMTQVPVLHRNWLHIDFN